MTSNINPNYPSVPVFSAPTGSAPMFNMPTGINISGRGKHQVAVGGSTIVGESAQRVKILPIGLAGLVGFLTPALIAYMRGEIQFEANSDRRTQFKVLCKYAWEHQKTSAFSAVAFMLLFRQVL